MDLKNGTQAEVVPGTKTHVGGYGGVEDKSTWVRLQPSSKNLQWAELSFNPVVTFISLAIILAFAVWAMVLPADANAEFANWQSWVGLNFTWLYIGSQVANTKFSGNLIIGFCIFRMPGLSLSSSST